MNIAALGLTLIWIALAATAVSALLYAVSSWRHDSSNVKLQKWATYSYSAAVAAVVGVCIALTTLLVTHDFNVEYVYKYSSRELEMRYLYATFWAGQDGSFLLWAFWIAVLGQVLLLTLSNVMRPRVMSVYIPTLLILLVILAVRDPFAAYTPAFGQLLHPTDGIGLNPLLENPWMVIHPPTLFLGFASLTIPFAFALASLIWGDDPDWYRRTWPWALFTFSSLGFGIMLGGYWAYETLGWGGFWGWDPVEDGPLVPWLIVLALLHSIQVNRVRGGLKKSTLFLALFGFVAALYETFLTRTGILDKFSNHSFSTLGGVANNIVIYYLVFALVLSLIFLAWRSVNIKSDVRVWDDVRSRDFGLTIAVIVIILCAVIVGAGMSAPLITSGLVRLHLLANQSSVQADFFNKANFPEAVLLGIGMAVGPFLSWGETKSKSFRPVLINLAIALVSTAIYAVAGSYLAHSQIRPVILPLFFTSIFAIASNCQILAVRVRPHKKSKIVTRTAGGALAHIGAALMLVGIVGLVLFTHKESVTMVQGEPVKLSIMPYSLTFTGMSSNLFHQQNVLNFLAASSDGKDKYDVQMPFAVRNVEGTNQILARPAISMRWWGDLYFAFEAGPNVYSPNKQSQFTLRRGDTVVERGSKISLLSYRIPANIDAEIAKGIIPDTYPVTAVLKIVSPNGQISTITAVNTRFKDDPISPAMPETALLQSNSEQLAIAFEGVDPDTQEAAFYVRDSSLPLITSYTIQVSTRPTISLVWIGTLILVVGGLLSAIRRASENVQSPIPDPSRVGRGAINAPKKHDNDTQNGRQTPRVKTKVSGRI